jgi:hypothetical protein
MTRIEISGWRSGANKVGADKLLANDAGLGLSGGKSLIDDVLAGQKSSFEVTNAQLAQTIITKLQHLGFDARLER